MNEKLESHRLVHLCFVTHVRVVWYLYGVFEGKPGQISRAGGIIASKEMSEGRKRLARGENMIQKIVRK